MKKIRKGKKILLILLIAIVAVVAIFIIKRVVDNSQKEPTDIVEQQVIPLPETTYSGMQVKNIQLEYLKEQNKTMVTMQINNTTVNKVENEKFDAILIGPDDEVLFQRETWINSLDVGEQYDVSVVLEGDLTATTQIKLMKK